MANFDITFDKNTFVVSTINGVASNIPVGGAILDKAKVTVCFWDNQVNWLQIFNPDGTKLITYEYNLPNEICEKCLEKILALNLKVNP